MILRECRYGCGGKLNPLQNICPKCGLTQINPKNLNPKHFPTLFRKERLNTWEQKARRDFKWR
jgi:hypothetical protein